MSLSPECKQAFQKSFGITLVMFVTAPMILIWLSHGKPFAILIALLFVPAIIRAILLYVALRNPIRQQDLEQYWNQHGKPSDLSVLFLLGSIPGPINPLAYDSNPPQDVERYRDHLRNSRRMTWFAFLILAVGLPPVCLAMSKGLGRPFHWDSLETPIVVPLLIAIQNSVRTFREQKNLVHYDRWIAEGSPRSFDPWQSKPKRR